MPTITALDQGEPNAAQVQDSASTYTFAVPRLLLPSTKLTVSRVIQLDITGAAALDILPLDVYGTNGHQLTVESAGSGTPVLKVITTSLPPARYFFQVSEDATLLVYVGAQNFQ